MEHAFIVASLKYLQSSIWVSSIRQYFFLAYHLFKIPFLPFQKEMLMTFYYQDTLHILLMKYIYILS